MKLQWELVHTTLEHPQFDMHIESDGENFLFTAVDGCTMREIFSIVMLASRYGNVIRFEGERNKLVITAEVMECNAIKFINPDGSMSIFRSR